ncbi:MAG TPA: AcrB/AcrD/AcrF family protein [Elusimicrobia bacterium]|nr:AcrB/AcrD/AcrF family protein [Elusimicrobiota bacterium]HBT61406.1 AcrB/AcrD/AcrF family protein [Elusimicrobiota bacterium]
MKIADICIKRPVFTTMMMCALVVVGIFSYRRLGLDLFPNIDLPFVIVSTTLAGSGPEEIETSITKPIEEAVNTISGIDNLKATSYEGLSQVFISFVLEKDIDVASQEVRDAVSRVQRDLPEGTDPPVVQKFDPGSMPVMSVAVSGDMPIRELTFIAKKQVKERLESVDGVGKISIIGGREREIHIVLNPLKMASFRLTVSRVKDALKQQNIEIPGGRVEQERREFVLRTMGRIEKPADFEKVVVATVNGVPVRIRDIGRAEDSAQDARSLARLDGKEAVSLIVQKQSGVNTVEVIERVKERLAEIKPTLPAGVRVDIIRDMSEFILGSVRSVEEHLVLGAILAALAVLLFMGAARPTLIAAMAIPTSIIATFLLIDRAGFTLNVMTLLGLALAVGIVIDDAIVVLENIFRHMEEDGTPAKEAASRATMEIGPAVMATTLSLVIIFLPLAYMGGIIGRFLRSYGLTVAFAIMVSLFVAFTLTPMLCSRFLKVEPVKNKFQILVERLNDFLKEHYGRMVLWAMANRWKVVLIAVAIALSSVPFLKMVGKDFLPPDDSGEFEINFTAPEGTSLSATDLILRQVEAEVRRLPHVTSIMGSIGEGEGANVNDARVYVRLENYAKRKLNQSQIIDLARRALAKYSALRLSVSPVSHFGGGGKQRDAQFQYYITGPDLEVLRAYSSKVVEALKATPGIVDVDTTLVFAKPEVKVRIDRDRAQDLGVKVEDIALGLRTMVSGEEKITKYKEGDELYEVRIRVDKQFRDRKEVVGGLYVPSSKVGLVRLDNVSQLVEDTGPSQIDRMNRQRQVGIVANLTGVPLNLAINKAEATIKALKLPPGYKTGLEGRSKEFGRMLSEFLLAFFLAAIFMYMILASQFENFLHPVTIMLSLPLAIPFAVLSLIVLNQYLTIYSIMGLFMLFGIVKKNAILQVDYTNTLRAQGMPRDQAILEANKTRLRPILMTTLVLVAAMIPVALGRGPGSASRATMAVVIVGGQTLCLLITLLIVPVAYSLFDDAGQWARARFKRRF